MSIGRLVVMATRRRKRLFRIYFSLQWLSDYSSDWLLPVLYFLIKIDKTTIVFQEVYKAWLKNGGLASILSVLTNIV